MEGIVEAYKSDTPTEGETNKAQKDNSLVAPDLAGASLEEIADRAMPLVVKQLETGILGRQGRFEQIRKNENMYAGETPPALRGRSNIPFDALVMGGFIDTLMANTNEPIDLSYGSRRLASKHAAKKLTAVFDEESGPNKGNWDMKIQDSKLLAALSGRGFGKLIIDNVPTFATDFYVPDHYDMVTEPQGGADLDKHLFKFEQNIFRSRGQLLEAAKSGFYNFKQVRKLIEAVTPPMLKEADDQYKNKLARFSVNGVATEALNFVGQPLWNLTEGVVSINGKWYYCLFEKSTQTWVRWERLEDVMPWGKKYPGRGAWTSWATHRHPTVFWSKAPADDIRAIAYTMKKILNLTIDNLEKRNWDMKAYDPRIFTNPTDLLYKQDALARATLRQGQKISDGVFSFQTPDTTAITINLMEYLDVFLGKKTGITEEAQGAGNANIAAIQIGNIAQLSKRMTLYNQQYSQMLNDLGIMFKIGVEGRLREPYAIRLIGSDAADWDEVFTPDEAKQDFSITVKAGANTEKEDLATTEKRDKFYDQLLSSPNPAVSGKISIPATIRARGRDAGVKDEEIDAILDLHDSTDLDIMADAATAIDNAILNRPMRIYRDADTAFVQYIIDFANKHYQVIPTGELSKLPKAKQKEYDEDMQEFDRLMALVKAHMPFVKKNADAQKAAAIAKNPSIAPKPQVPMRVTPAMHAQLAAPGADTTPPPEGDAPPVQTPPAQ